MSIRARTFVMVMNITHKEARRLKAAYKTKGIGFGICLMTQQEYEDMVLTFRARQVADELRAMDYLNSPRHLEETYPARLEDAEGQLVLED